MPGSSKAVSFATILSFFIASLLCSDFDGDRGAVLDSSSRDDDIDKTFSIYCALLHYTREVLLQEFQTSWFYNI